MRKVYYTTQPALPRLPPRHGGACRDRVQLRRVPVLDEHVVHAHGRAHGMADGLSFSGAVQAPYEDADQLPNGMADGLSVSGANQDAHKSAEQASDGLSNSISYDVAVVRAELRSD